MSDVAAFRHAMGHFTTGVTVLTARAGQRTLAVTVSSLVSVSLDPLLVLVCIARELPVHSAVGVGQPWAVSVLGAHQEGVSRTFASRRAGEAELADLPTVPGAQTGVPLLAEALATLECRTTAVHDGGDHDIVLGSVLSMAVADREDGPLVFYRGGYRSLG